MSSEDDDSISLADLPSHQFSDLEDNALEELFDIDEDEDEFEGFGFDLPENMTWERQCFAVNELGVTVSEQDIFCCHTFLSLLFYGYF